ncbi:MAG: MerR family transcriptional regulator [Melioribacteraceae bacterium]
MENKNTYPIKVVSNLTGLSIHVIRAWEKRYNVVVPQRSETNRRLYSKEDVEKLKLLSTASAHGYSIGTISTLNYYELKNLLNASKLSESEFSTNRMDQKNEVENTSHLDKCISAVKELNAHGLEYELYNALKDLSQPKFIDELLTPLLEDIGDMWKSGEIRIVNEHVSSAVIRKILNSLIDNNSIPSNAPSIIIATPKGQLHELGALMIAVIASADGWNVTYMGPDLPAEEIAAAIDRLRPKIVALSIVYPNDDFTLDREMAKLKRLLNNGTKIIAGGRSAKSYGKTLEYLNAKVLDNIDDFRKELEKVRN